MALEEFMTASRRVIWRMLWKELHGGGTNGCPKKGPLFDTGISLAIGGAACESRSGTRVLHGTAASTPPHPDHPPHPPARTDRHTLIRGQTGGHKLTHGKKGQKCQYMSIYVAMCRTKDKKYPCQFVAARLPVCRYMSIYVAMCRPHGPKHWG